MCLTLRRRVVGKVCYFLYKPYLGWRVTLLSCWGAVVTRGFWAPNVTLKNCFFFFLKQLLSLESHESGRGAADRSRAQVRRRAPHTRTWTCSPPAHKAVRTLRSIIGSVLRSLGHMWTLRFGPAASHISRRRPRHQHSHFHRWHGSGCRCRFRSHH